MRTTIRLDETLARQAKARAAERGVTFTQAVERALRQWIREDDAPEKRVPFDPPLSNAKSAPMTFEEFKQMMDDMQEEEDLHKLGLLKSSDEETADS